MKSILQTLIIAFIMFVSCIDFFCVMPFENSQIFSGTPVFLNINEPRFILFSGEVEVNFELKNPNLRQQNS